MQSLPTIYKCDTENIKGHLWDCDKVTNIISTMLKVNANSCNRNFLSQE